MSMAIATGAAPVPPGIAQTSTMRGWLRSDGRKGIRNTVVVAYLDRKSVV